MMPAEAERALREESAASSADSLEAALEDCEAPGRVRGLSWNFYGTAQGPLIPQPLVAKLAEPDVREDHRLGAGQLPRDGAASRAPAPRSGSEAGNINGPLSCRPSPTRLLRSRGREPSMPRDEDSRKLEYLEVRRLWQVHQVSCASSPAMQTSAIWLLGEEILWLLEGRARDRWRSHG